MATQIPTQQYPNSGTVFPVAPAISSKAVHFGKNYNPPHWDLVPAASTPTTGVVMGVGVDQDSSLPGLATLNATNTHQVLGGTTSVGPTFQPLGNFLVDPGENHGVIVKDGSLAGNPNFSCTGAGATGLVLTSAGGDAAPGWSLVDPAVIDPQDSTVGMTLISPGNAEPAWGYLVPYPPNGVLLTASINPGGEWLPAGSNGQVLMTGAGGNLQWVYLQVTSGPGAGGSVGPV